MGFTLVTLGEKGFNQLFVNFGICKKGIGINRLLVSKALALYNRSMSTCSPVHWH